MTRQVLAFSETDFNSPLISYACIGIRDPACLASLGASERAEGERERESGEFVAPRLFIYDAVKILVVIYETHTRVICSSARVYGRHRLKRYRVID